MHTDPGRTREQLDRAVVVCWTEPARDDEQVVGQPFCQRTLEVGRIVTDDRDARGLEPEPEQPRTSSEPDATIATRGRDANRWP